ncbi:MAG: hypothetical protein HY909_29285 [Deltaproteobacteria bacterium]|nr:hypothetical protein [Deltaproteobacteria bacterium]
MKTALHLALALALCGCPSRSVHQPAPLDAPQEAPTVDASQDLLADTTTPMELAPPSDSTPDSTPDTPPADAASCVTGRGDCDGMTANGCETDLTTDARHCGACGRACEGGYPCVDGACSAVQQVSVGALHTCVLRTNGRVYCLGDNSQGQLGVITPGDALRPTLVPGVTDIAEVSAGGDFTCARTRAGRVWCWGANRSGQLGTGATTTVGEPPRLVVDLEDARQVAAGSGFACALRDTREVVCWGSNGAFQLGDGTGGVGRASPRPVRAAGLTDVTHIATLQSGCAVRTDGSVWCWGQNTLGESSGDGSTGVRTLPTRVGGLSGAVRVAVGVGYTCAANVEGELRCWGGDNGSQLGARDGGASPYAVGLVPGLTDVDIDTQAFSLAYRSLCIRRRPRSGGGVLCLGTEARGELGDGMGPTGVARVPVAPAGLAAATAVSNAWDHRCALLPDGARRLRCWGANNHGQLGDGTTTDRDAPTDASQVP